MSNIVEPPTSAEQTAPVELKLHVSEGLCRAFQRCLWMQMAETSRSRQELTEELILDFLMRHEC